MKQITYKLGGMYYSIETLYLYEFPQPLNSKFVGVVEEYEPFMLISREQYKVQKLETSYTLKVLTADGIIGYTRATIDRMYQRQLKEMSAV